MALPTDQIKSTFLVHNGSLIPAIRAVLFVLFCQGKTLDRVELIFLPLCRPFWLLFLLQSVIAMSQGKRLLAKDMHGLSTVLSMVALR